MVHFPKILGLSQSKTLGLWLMTLIMTAPFAVSTYAQSDLAVFSTAYDQITVESNATLDPPTHEQKQAIQQILNEAGMTATITSIEPSKLPSMYQINLAQLPSAEPQPPLHMTKDGSYILQGELHPNPSPLISTPPKELPSETLSGMPVSETLRASILANTSQLKNITPDVALYYTAVPGVIWGSTVEGKPFITNTAANVFTSGEISVIKNGQFAGLDADFEQKKNLHVLSQLNEDNLVIYPATTQERAVIYMATDINCPYCRVMHNDIPALNAKGITVKVIGYPYYEHSAEQMRQIWCEPTEQGRRQALDDAMNGKPVAPTCSSTDVNHLLANQSKAAGLAVFATPAIYREDGVQLNASYKDPSFLAFLGL